MRRALLILAVLLVLFVGVDFVARELAQAALARELASSLELSRRPAVSLGGLPFLPRAVTGEIPAVEVRSGQTTSGGITFSEIVLGLADVEFSLLDIASGRGTLHADEGRGLARVSGITIDTSLAGRDVRIEVRFEDGVAMVASPLFQGSARAEVALVEGALSFASPALPEPLRIALPDLFGGIRYESLIVEGNVATLAFSIRDATIDLSSGTVGGRLGAESARAG